MKAIIQAQTIAATQIMQLGIGKHTISSGKLISAEVVTFQLIEDGVVTPGDLYKDGVIQQLTATNNALTIEGPIDIQVSKGVTAAAVGVYAKG